MLHVHVPVEVLPPSVTVKQGVKRKIILALPIAAVPYTPDSHARLHSLQKETALRTATRHGNVLFKQLENACSSIHCGYLPQDPTHSCIVSKVQPFTDSATKEPGCELVPVSKSCSQITISIWERGMPLNRPSCSL